MSRMAHEDLWNSNHMWIVKCSKTTSNQQKQIENIKKRFCWVTKNLSKNADFFWRRLQAYVTCLKLYSLTRNLTHMMIYFKFQSVLACWHLGLDWQYFNNSKPLYYGCFTSLHFHGHERGLNVSLAQGPEKGKSGPGFNRHNRILVNLQSVACYLVSISGNISYFCILKWAKLKVR